MQIGMSIFAKRDTSRENKNNFVFDDSLSISVKHDFTPKEVILSTKLLFLVPLSYFLCFLFLFILSLFLLFFFFCLCSLWIRLYIYVSVSIPRHFFTFLFSCIKLHESNVQRNYILRDLVQKGSIILCTCGTKRN